MTPATKLLKKKAIQFNIYHYQHDTNNTYFGLEAIEKTAIDAHRIYKTLIVQLDNHQLVVAVLPVLLQLNLKRIAKLFKVKKAELADAALAQKTTGYLVGGISPLGQKKQLPTVLDHSVTSFTTIFFSGGKRGLEIELSPFELKNLLNATITDITSH